jgi:ferric-dicitrate binding protein FerR (iron transport regulator)
MVMINNREWDLILRHLERNSSPQDQQKLSAWLKQNKNNKQLMAHLERIWNVPDDQMPAPDIEIGLQSVKEKAGINTSTAESMPSLRFEKKSRSFFDQLLGNKILRLAAVILIAAVFSFLVYHWSRPEVLQELQVPMAQKMTASLSDGTKVILDAGSYLRYPVQFNSQERQVYLNGEGYFEVKTDPDKPFVIYAGESIIKVLGTKFNVRTWPQNQMSRVSLTVVEGQVSFQAEGSNSGKVNVIVSEGKYSELFENQAPTAPRPINIEEQLSWLNRKINFRDAPLGEVLDQLERWFDIQIVLDNQSLATNRVAVFVDNNSLENILEVITLMNNLQYKQDGRKIILSERQ